MYFTPVFELVQGRDSEHILLSLLLLTYLKPFISHKYGEKACHLFAKGVWFTPVKWGFTAN